MRRKLSSLRIAFKMQTMIKSLRVLIILGLCVLFCMQSELSRAHNPSKGSSNWGAGFVLGEPSGLSARMWAGPSRAWDFALAYSVDDYVSVMANHVWIFTNAIPQDFKNIHLHPYLGFGGFFNFVDGTFDNDLIFGIRLPVGLEFAFQAVPLGIFLELAAAVPLFPETDVDLQGFLGVRYYF